MEPQIPIRGSQDEAFHEFTPGTPVIYGLHGKCLISRIETRLIDQHSIRFYRLEIQKAGVARSARTEPAIWIPVTSAQDKGLRPLMSQLQAEQALGILSNREYYFSVQESWSTVHAKLETCLRAEGGLGLAKVLSYLHVLKKKQIVPSSEVMKMYETVNRLLLRELSEVLKKPAKILEEQIQKGFRQKLLPDH